MRGFQHAAQNIVKIIIGVDHVDTATVRHDLFDS